MEGSKYAYILGFEIKGFYSISIFWSLNLCALYLYNTIFDKVFDLVIRKHHSLMYFMSFFRNYRNRSLVSHMQVSFVLSKIWTWKVLGPYCHYNYLYLFRYYTSETALYCTWDITITKFCILFSNDSISLKL